MALTISMVYMLFMAFMLYALNAIFMVLMVIAINTIRKRLGNRCLIHAIDKGLNEGFYLPNNAF